MDPPNLRKKHIANDKKKGKCTIYSSKHVRFLEQLKAKATNV